MGKLRRWRIWKTIKIGTGLKTGGDFCKALKDSGFKISDWAESILKESGFKMAAKEAELDLVKVTTRGLGFENKAQFNQICAKAKKIGLKFCSSELGPQLRIQYPNQPNGECINIVMEPIPDLKGDPSVFYVESDDSGLWLRARHGGPAYFFDLDDQLVFVHPRK